MFRVSIVLATFTIGAAGVTGCESDGDDTSKQRAPVGEGSGGEAGVGGGAGAVAGSGAGGQAGAGQWPECSGIEYPCLYGSAVKRCLREGQRVVCECVFSPKGMERNYECSPAPP